jgi:AcrR family transcriptional regulator
VNQLDVPERLIRAATVLFAERGYDATSVSDIVDAAQLTKGAMYYYFSAKEDLLFAIHQRFIEAEMEQAQAIVDVTHDPVARLKRLIVALIESIDTYHGEVTVFFREMHRLPETHFAKVRESRDAYEAIFEQAIRWGQQSGAFRDVSSPRLATLALFGLCNWTYTWMRPHGQLTATDIGERFADLFLYGMLRDPSTGQEK